MCFNFKELYFIIYVCESFVVCIYVYNVEEKNYNFYLRMFIVCYYF